MTPTSPLPPSTSTASPHSRPPDIHQSAATFNPAAWINHHLTPTSANSTPSLSSLLDSTDNLLQESHATLDSSLKSALKKVPWALRETERVRQRATSLRSRVDGVGARVDGVETGIVSSVRTIADADTVVRRVQQAATLLSHAASAEKLLDRLDSLLARAGGDGSHLVAAADVVADVRAALKPLQHIPELKDRFEHLQKADARLEQLAAPSLLSALQERNAQAARNARIVFDHAGRENAFREQYVQLRGAQIVHLWSRAWNTHSSTASTDVAIDKELNPHSMTSSSMLNASSKPGDLASPQAHQILVQFYKLVAELISTEATWLADAFPDLRDGLLPALMYESMDRLTDPVLSADIYVPSNASNAASSIDSIVESLFTSGTVSVEASAEIVQLLLPDDKDVASTQNGHSNENEINTDMREDDNAREDNTAVDAKNTPDNNGTASEVQQSTAGDARIAVLVSITDALTALLMPFRKFWETLQQTVVQQARIRANAIPLASVTSVNASSASTPGPKQTVCPPFEDLANDVEKLSKQSISLLDTSLTVLNHRTCGVGIDAMKQMINAASSTLSDRLLTALRLPVPSSRKGEESDEWTRVSGALRLLISTSSLKRSWDSKKESSFAVAIGTATPILEIASVITQDGPEAALRQFLNLVSTGNFVEAGIVWELFRDRNLSAKTVSHFESLDSTADFQPVVDVVHRLVYNAMFQGISDRFKSFKGRDFWSTESIDGESVTLGFSSSPLGYATEVADYLMTIPQQLEPFVPDEDDTTHATPKSQYIFSKAGMKSKKEESQQNGRDDENEEGEDDSNLSFAGMWIAVLSIGTMELYVEKICEVPRISEAGAKQLGTDTDYICNVIASLGVAPTPEMSLICRLLESKQDSTSFTEAAARVESSEHRKIARQIAAARGISVTL